VKRIFIVFRAGKSLFFFLFDHLFIAARIAVRPDKIIILNSIYNKRRMNLTGIQDPQ
jgi:hypothetical protein